MKLFILYFFLVLIVSNSFQTSVVLNSSYIKNIEFRILEKQSNCLQRCVRNIQNKIVQLKNRINTTTNINKKIPMSIYYDLETITSIQLGRSTYGCPGKIYDCNTTYLNSQKVNTYLNETYKELGKCGNYIYYISKYILNSPDALSSCCMANLTRAFIYNKNDLNCLIMLYNKLPESVVKSNTKFKISAWDIHLNRTYRNCPGGEIIKNELWAREQPNKCEIRKCDDYAVEIDLCKNCRTQGLNTFKVLAKVWNMCMKERKIKPTNENKQSSSKKIRYYASSALSLVQATYGCPKELFGCKYERINKMDAEKFLNESLFEIGICGSYKYYVSKSRVAALHSLQFCCKANLSNSFIYNKVQLECLVDLFNQLPVSKQITRAAIFIRDTFFNRTFMKCPGNDLVDDELWASGQPDKCRIGTCRTSEVFVDFCKNCSTQGLNAYQHIPILVLCMQEVFDNVEKATDTTTTLKDEESPYFKNDDFFSYS